MALFQPFVVNQPSYYQSITKYLIVGSGLVSALHETEISTKRNAKRTSKNKPANEEKTTSRKLRVILVRDEQTQSALQMKVPTSTLVLTIPQSKGMEFDDVFLYNFFTTSPYSSDFNILGDLLHEHHSLGTGEHARYANWEMVDNVSDNPIFSQAGGQVLTNDNLDPVF